VATLKVGSSIANPISKVSDLGAYIREQRSSAQISVRQLARLAGVSNPYLSQIERGLRRPSAEILQQIAKALRISAEALYVKAGILEERETDSDIPGAVVSDLTITERQKQVLLEIYESFRRENGSGGTSQRPDSVSGGASQRPDSVVANPALASPADTAPSAATSAKTRKAAR
jgi:transcriptional regulator with XRE-family HTH domain